MNILLNAGVSDNIKPYLKNKIRISNQVALLMAIVGLFYAIFSIIFYPPLTIYPVFCILLSFTAIALNYLELYNVSRFILSTLLILLAYLYHAFLVQPGEDYITSMYLIEFSLTVIPWVLIDYREKSLLIISLIACYLLLFTQSWANEALSIELDSSLFRSVWMSMISSAFGVMILILCLLFMQHKNFSSEKENEILMSDINEKNAEMEQQQSELQANLEEIKASRLIEEKQNWISNGIAKIGDLLHRSNDQEIFGKLIAAIVKYIQANQGCIYLLKEEDVNKKYLNLEACYAYERQKFMTKQVEIGQGLIGQCFLEKEYIILKEVPAEYLKITSGLGEAVPTFVVIVPIMEENRIDGVMEFALFHELEAYQIDFLTQLGANISSFVATSTLNIQTKKLLQQSQLQTEQLRTQEEEMRQNMEEMQRKEKEYLQRIEAFEEKQII